MREKIILTIMKTKQVERKQATEILIVAADNWERELKTFGSTPRKEN